MRYFTALALAELIADKLPFTRARTKPGGLLARMVTGGLSGAAVLRFTSRQVRPSTSPRRSPYSDSRRGAASRSASATARNARTSVMVVSGGYFPILGVQPLFGRTITPEDDLANGGNPAAVIDGRASDKSLLKLLRSPVTAASEERSTA